MAIIWAQDPGPEPHVSKRDLAESAGFDPGEDYNQPCAAWIEAEFQASGYASALDWFAASVEAARERSAGWTP